MINLSLPQEKIFFSEKKLNLFLAGYGSGKSHLAGIKSVDFITKYPNAKGFIAANTYNQLNTATLERVISVWKSCGYIEGQHFVINKQPPINFNIENHNFTNYHNIISFINGHIIFIGSLDNAKAHDGKEFDYCFLDETKDSKESDVKEIILGRMRGNEVPNNPIYILTSPAKVQWINEWFELENYKTEITNKIYSKTEYFYKEEKNKCVVISSTYHNSINLPVGYIQGLIDSNTEERAKALIYGNPFFTSGGEYYSSFSNLEHISNCEYNPNQALHFGFDQNVIPYTPALIGQIELIDNIWEVNIIDEIALQHPHNTTEHLSRELYRRYSAHTSGVFIYGDATGQRRSGLIANVQNHYEVIQQILKPLLCNTSMRVSKGNEPNIKRRQFMMAIMEGKLPIRLNVSPRCKLLIDDFTYVMEDIDGGKEKKKFTDANGKSFEKYGHCFAGEIEIKTMVGNKASNKAIKNININDIVYTTDGLNKVINVYNNGIKETNKYQLNKNIIQCTDAHKIYSVNFGFINIKLLITVFNLLPIHSVIIYTFVEKNICKKKHLLLTGLNLIGILLQKTNLMLIILVVGLKKMENGKKKGCTFIFGKNIMVKFLKNTIFIILMAIIQIIQLLILIVLVPKNIYNFITIIKQMSKKNILKKYYEKKHNQKQHCGINQKRVVIGIKNTLLKVFFIKKKKQKFVKNVHVNLKQKLKYKSIAQKDVKVDLMQGYLELIKNAKKINNNPIITEVYDIQVENMHEYFANNILVHNCSDILEYFIIQAFRKIYDNFIKISRL